MLGAGAHADMLIPAGATVDLASGAAFLACTDLQVAGTLIVGAGGSASGVRNARVAAGGRIELRGGRIEIAQQWENLGTVDVAGGQVLRSDSAACPASGAIGPFNPNDGVPPIAIPALGSSALVMLTALLGFGGLYMRRRERRVER